MGKQKKDISKEKELYNYIKIMSLKHNVPINEISICIMPTGSISIWQYIEGGATKNDKWNHLETIKIR